MELRVEASAADAAQTRSVDTCGISECGADKGVEKHPPCMGTVLGLILGGNKKFQSEIL